MWFLPPLLNVILILAGLLLIVRRRVLGTSLILLGSLSLLLFSTPWFSQLSLRCLEMHPPLAASELSELADELAEGAAVVVLGAGNDPYALQYDAFPLGEDAIIRLEYGAWLGSQLGLPLMVTGAAMSDGEPLHAEAMAAHLERLQQPPPRWIEGESRTTQENAARAAEILYSVGIDRVLLVTHSYHMRRSVMLFETQSLEVLPAPIKTSQELDGSSIKHWIPSARALMETRAVLHEYLGIAWYRIRGIRE